MSPVGIKEYRDRNKLTQAQLAEIAGVGIRAVQSWEQGKRNISDSAIKLLHQYEQRDSIGKDIAYSIDDAIAKKVYEKIEPDLIYFKKNSIEINQALAVGLLNLDELKDEIKEMRKKIDFIFKYVRSE